MKDILNNKRLLALIGGAVAVIVILIIVIMVIMGNKDNNENKLSLEDRLINMAGKFYTESQYKDVKNKEDLAAFETIGFNLDLNSLDIVVPIDKETRQLLDERKCDYKNTKVKIYPKKPFGEKDYTIKVELVCKN